MANKIPSTTSTVFTSREREALFRAVAGIAKGFAFAFGTVAGIGLLLAYCIALLKASQEHHIVYSVAALADSGFQHFLLIVGCVFTLGMLVAIGFTWSLVRNIIVAESVFRTSLHYRQKKKRAARRLRNSKPKNRDVAPFVIGVASILDFGNLMAPSPPGLTPRQKDYLALKSDWSAVGDDLQAAIK